MRNQQASLKTGGPPAVAQEPTFRSGAVARLVQMPVATLRIWEQRYRAVQPATSPAGQRLYSAHDVQRVQLLRQLTQRGQAIGSIAELNFAQLQDIAKTHLDTVRGKGQAPGRVTAPLRVVVVGRGLAARLGRPAVARRLAYSSPVLQVFETLEEAAQAAHGEPSDLLLWQVAGLDLRVPPAFDAARVATRAQKAGVVYRFAGAPAKKSFAGAGILLLREPNEDDALGAWLASVEPGSSPGTSPGTGQGSSRGVATSTTAIEPLGDLGLAAGLVSPRRYDDATLSAVANMSPSLVCECPQHVAELLMQLSSFEDYSAACINSSPADAALHAYLQQVASTSRALFESALERVALHEGLTLN